MPFAPEHWNSVYANLSAAGGSWTRANLNESLEAISRVAPSPDCSVLDIGGGLDSVAFELAARGREAYVIDISAVALGLPIGSDHEWRSGSPETLHRCAGDVLVAPLPTVGVWHDRATFHFFTDRAERLAYIQRAAAHVTEGGGIVVAGFSKTGPTHCSGLEVARRSPEALAEEFSDSFAVVESFERDHGTPAGVTQRFAWLLGRRI